MKRNSVQADSPDRLNVIVEGSKVIGDMITESNLRVDGEVVGNVSSAAKVVIGASGFIKGNLTCSDADIEGRIEGTIKVDSLLTLRSKAQIEGEISTGKLQVEEGAQFSGHCRMSNYRTTPTETKVPEQGVKEDMIY